ncbi:hypothetical protein [Rhodopirellula sp. SWK7]|uniref:hypothetical protein n=1 Tax=Rhodopirellula sp. SWK7 TaxID=595460 RepID=UPI00118189DF|nr:hypothetical protein [Rhodopirellula sp. SWK7]
MNHPYVICPGCHPTSVDASAAFDLIPVPTEEAARKIRNTLKKTLPDNPAEAGQYEANPEAEAKKAGWNIRFLEKLLFLAWF